MKIIAIPGINNLGKNNGCRDAGKRIFEELNNIHSSESGIIIDSKLIDFEELLLDNSNVEEQERKIYEKAKETIKNEKIFFLGGDHSISFSIGKAFLDNCLENRKIPCLIVFDSHADCMGPMKEPTHEEWLRALIEKGFPKENILLVGARNIYREEIEFLEKNRIKRVSINELQNNLEEVTDMIMEFSLGKELYVSLDIDVLDPVFAPSTGYPEAGGLTTRQLLYILSRINKIKTLKVIDLVEIDSEGDKNKDFLTVRTGAKLIFELF